MTSAEMTTKIARDVVRTSAEKGFCYFSVVHEGQLRILFIRPWGRRGQGIWLRRVSEGPAISPPWPPSSPSEDIACP